MNGRAGYPARGHMTPPPFLTKTRRRGTFRGWWSGLNRHGKLTTCAMVCAVAALVIAMALSAGADTGAAPAKKQARVQLPESQMAALAESVARNLEIARISLISSQLKAVSDEVSAAAPALEEKLDSLSQVVQGARCRAYTAGLVQASDAVRTPPEFAQFGSGAEEIPQDPEGIWRYANDLVADYIPKFKQYLGQLESLRSHLVAVGIPLPLKESHDLLLAACDLQLDAARNCIRGLELIRNLDEMTVGQALELVQDAAAKAAQGQDFLRRAADSLAAAD